MAPGQVQGTQGLRPGGRTPPDHVRCQHTELPLRSLQKTCLTAEPDSSSVLKVPLTFSTARSVGCAYSMAWRDQCVHILSIRVL